MAKTLMERMFVTLTRVTVTQESDGEGGYTQTLTDGETFAGCVYEQRDAIRAVAEKDAYTPGYTVTAEPGAGLRFHDVIKTPEGATFRILSDTPPIVSPPGSSIAAEVYDAERWPV